jgi:hypothetical protein
LDFWGWKRDAGMGREIFNKLYCIGPWEYWVFKHHGFYTEFYFLHPWNFIHAPLYSIFTLGYIESSSIMDFIKDFTFCISLVLHEPPAFHFFPSLAT